MRVRKAGKGQIFRCGVGHHWPEALVIEGQEPPHLNGTYCLPCFGIRVVGRLAVPRADLIADPFGPVEAEPEPPNAEGQGEPSIEGDPTPSETAAEVGMETQEEPVERAEEVPEGQEAEAGAEGFGPFAAPSTGDPGTPPAD